MTVLFRVAMAVLTRFSCSRKVWGSGQRPVKSFPWTISAHSSDSHHCIFCCNICKQSCHSNMLQQHANRIIDELSDHCHWLSMHEQNMWWEPGPCCIVILYVLLDVDVSQVDSFFKPTFRIFQKVQTLALKGLESLLVTLKREWSSHHLLACNEMISKKYYFVQWLTE